MKRRFRPIPRSAWTDRVVEFEHTDWRVLPLVVRVHHTAGPQPVYAVGNRDGNKAAERFLMRDIEQFHTTKRGYRAIAYNYVIMPSGRVYAGRGFEAEGAHTLEHNRDVGVCFAGNFESVKPTVRALVAYWRLRRYLRSHGVRIAGHAPHSATSATACPGRYLREALGL